MKRYSNVKNPKLEMADIDCNTVVSRILRDVQDLMILNTLRSLNALNTESPDFSAS